MQLQGRFPLLQDAYYKSAPDDDALRLPSTSKLEANGAKGGAHWDMSHPFSERLGACLHVFGTVLSKPHPLDFNPSAQGNPFEVPWFSSKTTMIHPGHFVTKVGDLAPMHALKMPP